MGFIDKNWERIKEGAILAFVREVITWTGGPQLAITILLAVMAMIWSYLSHLKPPLIVAIGLVVFASILAIIYFVLKIIEQSNTPKNNPDMDMDKAIDHVMDSLFPDRDPSHLNYGGEVLSACKAILEKLKSGELSSWGVRIENGTHIDDKTQSFDKSEWDYRELIPLSSHIPRFDKAQTKTPMGNQYPVQLTGLKVSSNQAKKLWPIENHDALRDWSIQDAFQWWLKTSGFEKDDAETLKFFDTLAQLAQDGPECGGITIWGRPNALHHSWEKIDKDHWKINRIDPISFIYATDANEVRNLPTYPKIGHENTGTQYLDLRLTSTEVKKKWREENI